MNQRSTSFCLIFNSQDLCSQRFLWTFFCVILHVILVLKYCARILSDGYFCRQLLLQVSAVFCLQFTRYFIILCEAAQKLHIFQFRFIPTDSKCDGLQIRRRQTNKLIIYLKKQSIFVHLGILQSTDSYLPTYARTYVQQCIFIQNLKDTLHLTCITNLLAMTKVFIQIGKYGLRYFIENIYITTCATKSKAQKLLVLEQILECEFVNWQVFVQTALTRCVICYLAIDFHMHGLLIGIQERTNELRNVACMRSYQSRNFSRLLLVVVVVIVISVCCIRHSLYLM
eukprot:TRINITY_DN1067_c2_g1_i2.p3 TRINITY_DN1067_c2_g1~~TRINITY_DN1067_c2_g1_i2.p3  ORF type:complete len:284 (-),score=-14.84 TRINITY_DN1067_c2_g1_i2:23-874(-)